MKLSGASFLFLAATTVLATAPPYPIRGGWRRAAGSVTISGTGPSRTGSGPQSTSTGTNNCPSGQIPDPGDGGTKPPCVPNWDLKCKKGTIAESRGRGYTYTSDDYEPNCGTDNSTWAGSCGKNLFDYKQVDFYVIQHSCRDTIAYRDEKFKKFQVVIDEWKKKKGEDDETKARDEKRRARAGQCLLALSLGYYWDPKDFEKFDRSGLDSLVSIWPADTPEPTLNIADNMVKITATIDGDKQTGLGLGDPVNEQDGDIRLIFPKATDGTGLNFADEWTGYGIWQDQMKQGKRQADAATLSTSVDQTLVTKVTSDAVYKKCLAMTDKFDTEVTVAAKPGGPEPNNPFYNYKIEIDSSLGDKSDALGPRSGLAGDSIILGWADGAGDKYDSYARSYYDLYQRNTRLQYESCVPLPDAGKNIISSLYVSGGCCQFFDDANCNDLVLSVGLGADPGRATDLGTGPADNKIESYLCSMTTC